MKHSPDLDPCGCCDKPTSDLSHRNLPGLSKLRYRIGSHANFKERMLALLSSHQIPDGDYLGNRPLAKLTTRSDQDAALAAIDAWAMVADILTFYQERIANECYLRTATERRSILELARAIGYELSPGVSASTYLAFTLDESDKAPSSVEIPTGTQIQSLPDKKGQLPQTFETGEDFIAYPAWNKLVPWQHSIQTDLASRKTIYLQGTDYQLNAGDYLLINPSGSPKFRCIAQVKTLADKKLTCITLSDGSDPSVSPPTCSSPEIPGSESLVFNASNVQTFILGKTWSESSLQAFLKINAWDSQMLLDYIAEYRESSPDQVYAFRSRCGVFGSSAPHYASLPTQTQSPYQDWDPVNGWPIWKDSLSRINNYYQEADLLLERQIEGLEPGSWLVLRRPGSSSAATEVLMLKESRELAKTGFALSARVTALDLSQTDGSDLANTSTAKDANFTIRNTTVYLKSEALTLAALPVTDELCAGTLEITLSGLVLGLQAGQPLALSGERAAEPGVESSEILKIDQVTHCQGFTTLKFTSGLSCSYQRASVRLNANVVAATHGETVTNETLGSGNGSQSFQQFSLKKAPLTHTSSSSSSGAQSSLSIKVNQVTWHQAESLYGLEKTNRSYVVRIDNQGKAHVIFGDGQQGARLPSGQNNVTASYRSGIGTAGEVAAGSLSLMKTRPFGVKSVSNPVKASGSADPEKLADARTNAPLKVMTLERIVSLHDYQAFAQAFSGVGKALAEVFWNGEQQLVYVTIADANGDVVAPVDKLYENLLAAMHTYRDPRQEVRLGSFKPLFFDLEANLKIDPDYDPEEIKSNVKTALVKHFSFEKRDFGQPVSAAEVVSIIHSSHAVLSVDLDILALTTTSSSAGSTPNSVLPASLTRWDQSAGTLQPAELLLINPYGITLRS